MSCQYFHTVSSATITGGNLVLAFADAPTGIVDTNRFCFCIPNTVALPSGYQPLPVVLTINGANVPLWNKYGDIVYGANLTQKYVYKGYYGTGTANHVITSSIPTPVYCTNACY